MPRNSARQVLALPGKVPDSAALPAVGVLVAELPGLEASAPEALGEAELLLLRVRPVERRLEQRVLLVELPQLRWAPLRVRPKPFPDLPCLLAGTVHNRPEWPRCSAIHAADKRELR